MNCVLMNLVLVSLILSPGSFFSFFHTGDPQCFNEISGNDGFFDQDNSTLFGNGYIEELADSCIDDEGNIYVVGSTQSSHFPTTPGIAYSQNQGDRDVFVAKINPSCEEVIFSTYLGGSERDVGKGICVDDEGYVYVTGYTSSEDFPTTEGAFNRTNSGTYDIFVTKFTPDGSDLVYSTYIGGSSYDWAEKIAVDEDGSAYITGRTYTNDYPVTRERYSNYDINHSLIITKFDPTGSFLEYSTMIGAGYSEGKDITIDEQGNTYVTGYTRSPSFYVMDDTFDTVHNGFNDVIVVKLDLDGGLIFSTFVGGSYDDFGYGIAVDSNEDIYITGSTGQETLGSYDFPVTSGAFKTYMNNTGDAFVFKMNKSGGSMEYSTYLGGDYGERGISIDLDENNNAIVGGQVNSDDYHTTYGAFSRAKFGGIWDAFLTVMNEDGSDLIYSTYLGGSDDDYGKAVHYRGNNTVLIAGYTESDDFPVSQNAIQTEHGPNEDGFVTILNLTTVPSPPRNLTYSLEVSYELNLSWDEPLHDGGSPLIGYNVYRASLSGDYQRIETTSPKNTSIRIDDHNPTKGWRYHVRSENMLGESMPGNIIILDDILDPYFIDDRTAGTGYTGDPLEFIVDIGDDFGVSEVGLEILQNDYIIFNGSMRSTHGSEWRYSFTVPHSTDPLQYRFHAFDFRKNTNISVYKTVSIMDNDAPIITIRSVPGIATTGDEMTIECDLFDHIHVLGGWLEIKGSGHDADPIDLVEIESGVWSSSYVVPSNNINDILFSINATDGNNYNGTPWRTVQVMDNDAPELIGDSSDIAAYNDREFDITVEMVDNIGVSNVWSMISFGDEVFSNISMDNVGDDHYSTSIDIPLSTTIFSYSVYSVDAEGNLYSSNETLFSVMDGISPIILDDLSSIKAYTGDPFDFLVSVNDNIGMDEVYVDYWFGDDPDHSSLKMNLMDYYEATLIVPSDEVDKLHYLIKARDMSGNLRISDEKVVEVIDNDSPVLIVSNPPSEIGTGQLLEIGINMTDNISPTTLSVNILHDGDQWGWDNRSLSSDIVDMWELQIPVDIVGDLSIFFFIGDGSGNENGSGPYTISIIDVLPPTIFDVEDLSVRKGEQFIVKVQAEDNIGISSYKWIGLPQFSSNETWEGKINEPGEYPVTVVVSDDGGNEVSISFLITVNEVEDDISIVSILVAGIVMVLIVALVVFYLLSRRREKMGETITQRGDLVTNRPFSDVSNNIENIPDIDK